MVKNILIKIIVTVTLLGIAFWSGVTLSSTHGMQETVLIHGKGEDWTIEEFKVIKYKNKVQWGGGKLKYYGDNKDLDALVGFEFEIVKSSINEKAKVTVLYATSVESNKAFSLGGETAAITFGKIEKDEHRSINIETFEKNITVKEDYNFDNHYKTLAKISLKYIDGKEIQVDFPLEMVVINPATLNEIAVHSKVLR